MTDKILTQTNTNEELIKKSLFIGICSCVKSPTEFFAFLDKHQDIHATHNCWAYRIGNEYRFNDDGEPAGTAGKPILSAIDGSGFDCIGALVIRHYGGIKLGTGGLARAYGGTIARILNQAPYQLLIPEIELTVKVDFQYGQSLHQLLAQLGGQSSKQTFTTDGETHTIKLPKHLHQDFIDSLNNQTKGSATII